ncbi:MAG: hypothetical protein WDM81_04300 [Rhizomicrobium sp.]
MITIFVRPGSGRFGKLSQSCADDHRLADRQRLETFHVFGNAPGKAPGIADYAVVGARSTKTIGMLIRRPASPAPRLQAVDEPARIGLGTEAVVEIDRRLVPVEHRPVDAGGARRHRRLREVGKQRLAMPRPRWRGAHRGLRDRSRAWPQSSNTSSTSGEPRRFARIEQQIAIQQRRVAKIVSPDHLGRDVENGHQLFVFGELAQQREDDVLLARPRAPDLEARHPHVPLNFAGGTLPRN